MLLDELAVRNARERYEELRREVEWERQVKAALASNRAPRMGLVRVIQSWTARARVRVAGTIGMSTNREQAQALEAARAKGGV